jgi:hypothetical protein
MSSFAYSALAPMSSPHEVICHLVMYNLSVGTPTNLKSNFSQEQKEQRDIVPAAKIVSLFFEREAHSITDGGHSLLGHVKYPGYISEFGQEAQNRKFSQQLASENNKWCAVFKEVDGEWKRWMHTVHCRSVAHCKQGGPYLFDRAACVAV